jgi:hypothetical protein
MVAPHAGHLSPAWSLPAPTHPVRAGRPCAHVDSAARLKTRYLLTP